MAAAKKRPAKAVAPKKMGRPPIVGASKKGDFIRVIRAGMSMVQACRAIGVSRTAVYEAMDADPEFASKYEQARVKSVDGLVDKALEMAEDCTVSGRTMPEIAGRKVYIGQLNWMAARIAPNRWGERSSVNVELQLESNEATIAKRMAFLQRVTAPTIDAEAVEVVEDEEGSGLGEDPVD